MESCDSNESERDEEQMSQNTNSNSNSASVTVPTGPCVTKFGYKEFAVKGQRWHALQGVGTAPSAFRTK